MPDAPNTTVGPRSSGRCRRRSQTPSSACCATTPRGPTHAPTTIGPDTIVVTLRDSLTKAERTPANRGPATDVLAMRRAFSEQRCVTT